MEAPIPASLTERGRLYKVHDSTKDDGQRVVRLMNRLQTCREQRTETQANYKDLRAVEHFQVLFDQQEKELQRTEESMAIVMKQFEQRKVNILQRKAYVEEKLKKAQERVESQKSSKGKEEMNLEKEIKELILTYKEKADDLIKANISPWSQVEFSNAEKMIGFTPTPPLPPTPPPLPPPAPKFKGKRTIKAAEDRPLPAVVEPVSEPEAQSEEEQEAPPAPLPEENPLAKMTNKQIESLSEAEMFSLLHPGKENPFNVIQNSKKKRPVKAA